MSYNGYNGLGCPGTSGCGCSGLGAYFTTYPGQVMSGMGESATSTFSASAVWADAQAGAAGNNAAGARATKAVQAGLNELGYGPLPVNGSWGSQTTAAWKSFRSRNGLSAGTGLVQYDGLVVMETQLKQGKATGPNEPVSYQVVDGQYVPTSAVAPPAEKKAGLGTGVLLLLGAVVVGGVIIYAKKKKGQQTTTLRGGQPSGLGRDMDSYGSSRLYASVKE